MMMTAAWLSELLLCAEGRPRGVSALTGGHHHHPPSAKGVPEFGGAAPGAPAGWEARDKGPTVPRISGAGKAAAWSTCTQGLLGA